MTKEQLEAIFDRVRTWPAEKQQEAAEVLLWLEKSDEVYELSEEELAGIRRGLDDVENGRFATEEQVAALFAKARRR